MPKVNPVSKTALVFILLVMIASVATAQKLHDVIYLKNGSVIKGTIIEQIPGESVKVRTGESTIIVAMDEIEKMSKEFQDDNRRNGYIGLMLGLSTPHGDFSDQRSGYASGGSHLNLVRFGYLLSGNIGVTAQWYGGANFYGPNFLDNQLWSYGGLMFGLLYSPGKKTAVKKWEFDISPMIGYAGTICPDFGSGTDEDLSGAFMLSGTARWNVGKKVAVLIALDWFYTKPTFETYDRTQEIVTSTFGVGVAYRLR